MKDKIPDEAMRIIETVCGAYFTDVVLNMTIYKGWTGPAFTLRRVCIYLIAVHTKIPKKQINNMFGMRKPKYVYTVVSGVSSRRMSDKRMAELINACEKKILA